MKKYKLIADGYSYHKKDVIYSEDYQHPSSWGNIRQLVEQNPGHWKLVEDDFVLPEKWYIRSNNQIDGVLVNWRGGGHTREPNVSILCSEKCWINPEIHDFSNYTEITFEQFKKYVLNMKEEKEIIGYKLIKREFLPALKSICNGWSENLYESDGFNVKVNTGAQYSFQEAGVLDLWFEPVYKEITPQITINGYEGAFFDDHVKFGCAKIAKGLILKIWDLIVNPNWEKLNSKEIESITIGKGTFTKKQIKEIAEYYLNKK